jgi:hypothetical protein
MLSLLFPVVKGPRQKPPWTIRPPSSDTNYTSCLSSYGELLTFMGNLTGCNGGWCFNEISNQNALAKARAGVWWYCGEPLLKILPENWSGTCALVQLAIPFTLVFNNPASQKGDSSPKIKEVQQRWLQAVIWLTCLHRCQWSPRGVPDEFKARNQIAVDFECYSGGPVKKM